jgi:integrase
MAVDDLWYKKDPKTGKKVPSKRHGRGKRWRVRYLDDNGKLCQPLFDKWSDARDHDINMRADVSRGHYIDPAAGKVSVAEYSSTWREAQIHRDSTAELVERSFRLHINPIIGNLSISRVRSTHVQSLIKQMDLAPSSARVVHSHLVAMFNAAVRDRLISFSPCVGISLPELNTTEHSILTPKQVHALAEASLPWFRAAVYVGAGCGLRPGEMLGLELEHIDFLRREVKVVQQLRTATGIGPFLAPTKTKTSRRTVELPKITANALAHHLEKYPAIPVEVPDRTDPRKPTTRQARLLFTACGEPVSRSVWSKAWVPAARAAKLPPGTGFHALRHYFATLLIFAGASVKTVQVALGHSTPTTTLNTYVGLWPDQIDRTRTLVDHALGTSAAGVEAS